MNIRDAQGLPAAPVGPPRPLSIAKKFVFSTILAALLVPLLLLGLEAALRLGGFGYSPHFARRMTLPDGTAVWRENRWVTAPYFGQALVRRPQPFRLPVAKAPGTYRIFILGSSAAMGDPEPSFSLARTLEKLLQAAYPELRFEVVNAGITAINSHLVRRIAADCAELQPDLFIVYEGNNEVIGPFGPAGVFTPFLRGEAPLRLAVWLKASRIGQLVSRLARASSSRQGAPEDWGGMQMFLQQAITRDDPRLEAVRTHFRANLAAIAASAHHAGAHMIACTVLTNQRDFAPFLSRHRPTLGAAERASCDAHLAAGQTAQREHDLARAEREYRAALALDPDYAELAFRLGRLLLQRGAEAEAAELLRRAVDLDALRFRTDSRLNAIVREGAATPSPGVEVLDLERELAASSAYGLPGDELIYEHVHLTLRGTFEASQALFQRVGADLVRRGLVPTAKPVPFSYDEARIRLGYTMHEQAMIALEMVKRFRVPPFTGQIDHSYRLQTWQRRADAATALLASPDSLPALREIYRQAMELAPDDWVLARNA